MDFLGSKGPQDYSFDKVAAAFSERGWRGHQVKVKFMFAADGSFGVTKTRA
jgi:hypothetical protein